MLVEIRSSGQSDDTFHYYVTAVNSNGESGESNTVSTIGEQVLTKEVVADRVESTLPETFILLQNHPNPFNPQTELRYGLPQAGTVELDIVNILGQQVRTLVAAQQQAGWHRSVWDGRDDRGNVVPA